MSIRERKDRKLKFEVRVYVGRDEKGPKYLTRSCATRKDAREVEVELTRMVAAGVAPDRPATITELIERYLELGDVRRPDEDRSVYRNRMSKDLGKLKLAQLTPERIDRWALRMQREGWRGTPLTPDTIQRTLNILSGACTLAVRYGWMTSPHPVERARRWQTPEHEREQEYTPTPDQVAFALGEAEEPLRSIILVALASGARAGELAALRWSCYDGATLTIRQSVEDRKGGPVLGPTKNRRVRTLALDEPTCSLLNERCVMQQAIAAADELPLDDDPFIFSPVLEGSKHYRSDGLTQMMDRFVEQHAELEGMTMHSLRRFHATTLAAIGVTPHAIKDRLGHVSLATTERYRAKVSSVDVAAAESFGIALAALLDG